MNAAQLLALYDRVAEAPDAVARLRRLVLDLAVRGKLVEQNPADEPASELLKRIAAEKARLGIKETITSSTGTEAPFELPFGWTWTTIGEACSKTGSGSTPRGGREVYKTAGVAFLRSQNVHDDGLRMYDVAYIEPSVHARMRGTQVMAGDLLLNITGGSIGRCCRVPDDFEEANVSQHVAIIRPSLKGMADFLHLLVLSPYFQAFVLNEQTGAGRGGLPKNRMDRIAVALPPLAEQQRIVAKVAELMALCDRLEAGRTAREGTRNRLTLASLARMTAPDTDAEALRAYARFALDALPALATRPDQIRTLRQTILDLAVRGKLVKQDPADEPASELLSRLHFETGSSQKRMARSSSQQEPTDSPFECPLGWSWTKVRHVLDPGRDISYGVIKLGPEPKSGGIPTLRCSDVRPGFIDLAGVRNVEESIEAEYARTRLEGGEIVINIRGTLGGVALVPPDLKSYNVAREVAVIPIAGELSGPFLVYLMLSPYFWDHIQDNLRGIAYKGLNLGILRDLPIPLPPLAEQHRVVAKVDALMALCDRLEAALAAADATRAGLLEALLYGALTPAPREMEAAE